MVGALAGIEIGTSDPCIPWANCLCITRISAFVYLVYFVVITLSLTL